MHVHEYAQYDATGLRELIAAGLVTPAEIEAAGRAALLQVDAELGALTGPLYDPAPTSDPRGVLAGVPIVVKDGGPFVRGGSFHLGSRAIEGAVAQQDHALMTLFRGAGLVALGQSTAPEFGLSFATESPRYGATRNPWNPDRGVGGSSGGAAALVAAGAVPIAHASDAGGSIRVPAAACGVVGLKPTRGRTPVGPLAGEAAFGQLVEFGITRSIRDAALLLDVASVVPSGEKHALRAPAIPFRDLVRRSPGRLRIGVRTEPWSIAEVDPQAADVARAAGELLEWIGHIVMDESFDLAAEDVVEASMLTVLASGTAILRSSPGIDRSLLEGVSRQILRESAAASAADVMLALDAERRVSSAVAAFFDDHDLLVTPTLASEALPHGALGADAEGWTARAWLARIYAFGPFTAPFNIAGNPAISLPLGSSSDGMPLGVQLVAARGREDLLLAVAAQLEEAAPWAGRRPRLGLR